MAGLSGLLGIARDAMAAQSFGLSVTGQNVSNVNTAGYVRREAMLETIGVRGAPLGGVRASGLRRTTDELVERRWYQANSYASSASERDTALSHVESLLNDAEGFGIRSDIDALFTSFSALSANPSDPTARAVVLSRADALTRRFQQTSTGLTQTRDDLATKATGTAHQVNELTARIAQLNKEISIAESDGNVAADLRDQQGELVRALSDLMDINALQSEQGLVLLSGGIALVEGGTHASISVGVNASGMLEVNAQRPSGATVEIGSRLEGGSLAGIIRARDVDIPEIAGAIDQLAYDLATTINTQHAAGFGLDGATGRNLFVATPPPGTAYTLQLDPSVDGNPDAIAASSTSAGLPGGSDNAAALASLVSANVFDGGTHTAAQSYSAIIGRIGSMRDAASREVEVRGAMQEQLQTMRDSVAGVSLDEEMVSLTRYQRAYEAATKIVSTVDELLGELIRQV